MPFPPRGPGTRHPGRPSGRRPAACFAGCALLVFLAVISLLVLLLLTAVRVLGSSTLAAVISSVALGLCVIAALGVAVAARRLVPPVGGLIDAARRVESGDYSARVPARGPRQVRSLARAFNAMSARLETEETRRRSVLADIAHEMRTPLTVIRSQAEAIADGVNPADEEHLAPIVAATHALESLADDLRTLTLADAGSLHLEREPVDVPVLVNETLDAFAPEAASAGVQLTRRLDPDLPPLDADAARMRRVLGNLLSNALAHTGRGGTVTVEADALPGWVRITVRDDGSGIPAELLPHVFDRFVKGPGSTGSGLGLAIVRDLVDAHGGSVAAHSTEGQGTAIEVTLPV